MKKLIGIFVIFIAVIGGVGVHFVMNPQLDKFVLVENVEALTESDVTDHYWCCGHTDTCAKGDNLIIKGKFQSVPCQ